MTPALDATHDPTATSWVSSAQDVRYRLPRAEPAARCLLAARPGVSDDRLGIAIGDQVLDLSGCLEAQVIGFERADLQKACGAQRLNALLALDRDAWRMLRREVFDLLTTREPATAGPGTAAPAGDAHVAMPCRRAGDYTDFYASMHHATNVGRMMRPDNPLLPNYKWIPSAITAVPRHWW